MKCSLVCCVCLAFMVSMACAETLTLDNGGISFEAPDGFKPLAKELIAAKFPKSRPPR